MLDRLLALEAFGIKLGLENITRLCEALGHPERAYAKLHVAGTNGKGSVTAMAHAALLAAGHHAARYTSPHLTDITERFVIGRAPVGRDDFDRAAADVLDRADRLRAEEVLRATPTFFEATTAVAFELFRRAGVDAAVIEVGLGGRFDATNVITPMVSAITTIAIDHVEHLGTTLEQIAFEKAGIIKPGVPVVVGPLPPEAMEVTRRAASERGSPLIESARDISLSIRMQDDGRTQITLRTPTATYADVTLALRGDHQIVNAVTAVRLLEAARDAGLDVPHDAIVGGLEQAEWPARLELIAIDARRRLLLDAAHNAEGAAALAAYLRRWHPERPALVIGMMRDKDADTILTQLLPEVSSVIATAAPMTRALPADDLARRIATLAPPQLPITAVADPEEALERAFAAADTVCVAGSIFLAGVVRDALKRRAILR